MTSQEDSKMITIEDKKTESESPFLASSIKKDHLHVLGTGKGQNMMKTCQSSIKQNTQQVGIYP
jgi:hypothetical protein